jgi:hypothetical protein
MALRKVTFFNRKCIVLEPLEENGHAKVKS